MQSLEVLRRARWISLSTLLAFAPVMGAGALTGCAPTEGAAAGEGVDETPDDTNGAYGENDESRLDEVTAVSHTQVRRQSIGNCWIYATVGWVESLRKRYNNENANLSETYITYWHWYEQLTSGQISGNEMETGGHWGEAVDLMRERGIVTEAAFIPEEASLEMSAVQHSALEAINASLTSGALRDPAARTNRMTVRAELNRAFGLNATVKAELDRVFGADGSRTLLDTANARTTSRMITKASSYQLVAATSTRRALTLADLGGTPRSEWNPNQRRGTYAWQGVSYPSTATARTDFLKRVLKAMNDGHPVLISWLVDFNALDSEGAFRLAEVTRRGIGRQGGHLTVLSDYVVDNVPGYGTLGIGALPTAQRTAALQGTVRFLRIKNSWGATRPDRASQNGYYDLYLDYLNGPIQWRGEATTGNGYPQTPFDDVVLPPGY